MSERRFTHKPKLDPQAVLELPSHHPALVGNRTLFPSTVVTVTKRNPGRLLISGRENRKIGATVEKGRFKGYGIYMLSLEERATCPTDCSARSFCFGNGMQMARRHRIGEADVFFDRLTSEITDLLDNHDGILIRLHVLGDFPSVEYVSFWKDILDDHPRAAIYGYTHRRTVADGGDEIGDAIQSVKEAHPDRFRIRWSCDKAKSDGAVILNRVPHGKRSADGEIVCPAQTDATACCATCGLCWESSASKECIGFVKHGRHSDTAVANSLRDWDRERFDRELTEAIPHAKKFAMGLCRNASKADDVVQEAVAKALENREKFELGTSMRAWLFTILRNHFYSEARKAGREIQDTEGFHTANMVGSENPADALEASEAIERIHSLPDEHRHALIDAGLGLKLEESATKNGVAVGTAKSRLSRARESLRDSLESNHRPVRILEDMRPRVMERPRLVEAPRKPLGIGHRRIASVTFPTIRPTEISDAPEIRRVRPTDLIVEESYQRQLSGKSIKLIKKIVAGWDWAKFKPPVCAESDQGLFVIDGQHTAIAAASHPGIREIPVMVVKRDLIETRADAFVSQNTARVAMSPLQVFHAEVVAGKRDAVDILKSATRAGGTIPKSVPAKGRSEPGQITAITALRRVYSTDGIAKLDRVIKIAVLSGLHPVNSTLVYALQYIVKLDKGGPFSFACSHSDERIAQSVASFADFDGMAQTMASDQGMNRFRAAACLIQSEIEEPSDVAA